MLQGILLLLQNVDWSEPWIIGLLVFHSLSTGAVFLLYKTQAFNIQVALFGVLMVLACLTETVNEYGATHWKLFARHQYFDTNGFFITWMYAAPIVVNCLLIIIMCSMGKWTNRSGRQMRLVECRYKDGWYLQTERGKQG
ncbi:transmembrane protein 18-like isoform X2 [Corticium candelabrum]|uniref:transmembrane protein 18-like isoform X2 n=1 Tax=Corticium candelabrum TaxID=121492 RepID=UPI002E25A89A|nr:transmembrane protein 18-like isoform X2 [Corticium candelabrum]